LPPRSAQLERYTSPGSHSYQSLLGTSAIERDAVLDNMTSESTLNDPIKLPASSNLNNGTASYFLEDMAFSFGSTSNAQLNNTDLGLQQDASWFDFDNVWPVSDSCFRLFEAPDPASISTPTPTHKPLDSPFLESLFSENVSGINTNSINMVNASSSNSRQSPDSGLAFGGQEGEDIQQAPIIPTDSGLDPWLLEPAWDFAPLAPIDFEASYSPTEAHAEAVDELPTSNNISNVTNTLESSGRRVHTTLDIPRQPGRRGPFKCPKERELTGVTRRLGACVRCRMQKIRVHLTLFRLVSSSRVTVYH
jgi:hypothetical protein